MANDTIQSISIGLGLDVGQLEKDARAAKETLDRILPKKQERLLTLRPKVDNSAEESILAQIEGIRGKAQKKLDAKPFELKPRFTASKTAVNEFRTSIETQLKGSPIRIPITVGRINKRQIQSDIATAIGTVPIGLSWKWAKGVKPPTEFEATVTVHYRAAGGPPPPPNAGGGGPGPGPAAGPAPTGTRAETRAANQAAHAAERETRRPAATQAARATRAETHAANQAAHAQRQADDAQRRQAAKEKTGAASTPAQETARRASGPLASAPRPPRASTGAAGATAGARPTGRQRTSMDELRRGPQTFTYSPADYLAQEMEKSFGTTARKPSTSGVHGGTRAGDFVRPADVAAANRPISPALQAQRDAAWQHHLALVNHYENIVAVNARKGDPAWQRSRAIVNAMKSVKRDPSTGQLDTSEMDKLLRARFKDAGGDLAQGYGQFLSGDMQDARESINSAFKDFGIRSGVAKGGRKLSKSLNPESKAFNKQAPDIQLFGEIGQAVRAEAAIASNPDAVLRNRSVVGRSYGPRSYRRGPNQTNTGGTTREDLSEKLEEQQGNFAMAPGDPDDPAYQLWLKRQGKNEPDTGVILDPKTGKQVFVSEHDARAKAKAAAQRTNPTIDERRRVRRESKAQFAARVAKGEAAYPIGQATPGTEPGQLPPKQGPFPGGSTPSAEDLAAAGQGRSFGRSRPTQNMGGGPTPRNVEYESRKASQEQVFRDFFGGAFAKGFGFSGTPRGRPESAKRPGDPTVEKLKRMALFGQSPREQQIALNFMLSRGHTGLFSDDERTSLTGMGLDITGLAEGGPVNPFSRPFGMSIGGGHTNVARENSYEWKKLRSQQLRRQPFCVNCGMGRGEARFRGIPLTADHIHSQAQGGDPWDINNLQTLCRDCNSAKGHLSMAINNFAKPRRYKRVDNRAYGGHVAGGLAARLAGAYHVNERGEEGYESESGRYDQLLGKQERIFMPPEAGRIIPHHQVPEWLRRAQEKQAKYGFVAEKELGRAEGGDVFPNIHYRNLRGNRFASAAGAAGEAFTAGAASTFRPEVQRVFVVNWPAGLIHPAAQQGRAGQPGAAQGAAAPPRAGGGAAAAAGAPGAGFAGAGPAAGAQPGATVTGNRKLSAEQRAISRLSAQESLEGLRAQIGDIRANAAEQLQLTPVRALSVSVGQIFQTAFGGRGDILRRSRTANRLSGVAERNVGAAQAEQQRLAEERVRARDLAVTPGVTPQQISDQKALVTDRLKAERLSRRAARVSTLEADLATRGENAVLKEIHEQAADEGRAPNQRRIREVQQTAASLRAQGVETGGIATRGNRLQAQALGVVGVVAGTLAFTAAMQVAQLAVDQLSKVVENTADALTGFAGTTARATEALAPATKAVSGAPRAGLAQVFAGLGISGQNLGQAGAFAGRLAGAQNLQQTIDLIRTEANLRQQVGTNPNVVPGIGTGFGNGPLAGFGLGQIGQTPGALEQLGGLFAGRNPSNFEQIPVVGGILGALTPFAENISGHAQPRGASGARALLQTGLPQIATQIPFIGGLMGDWVKNLQAQGTAQVSFTDDIATLNDKLHRTIGDAGKFTATQNQALLNATIDAFDKAGNRKAGEQIAGAGIALVGAGGAAPTAELANQAGQAALSLMPSREELINFMKPQLATSLAGIALNAQRQRTDIIPTGLAEQLRVNQPLAPGTGLVGGPVTGATFGPGTSPIAGLSQNAAANISSVTAAVQETQAAEKAAAASGEEWLKGLSAEGQAALQAVTDLGSQIAKINTVEANMQAGFQGEQMNRQMELQIRQLGDLVGLSGKQAVNVQTVVGYDDQGNKILGNTIVKQTQLGKLQHDQLVLSRQDQQIQLDQQQRQINFGLALARIGVPGESPAERAANLAYNKQVAEEQQQQHDRQQSLFDLAKSIQDVGIKINVQDATKELQTLSQSDALTLKVQGLDQEKSALTDLMSGQKAIADSYISELQSSKQAISDAWLATEGAMNSFETKYNATIDAGLKSLTDKYAAFLGVAAPGATDTNTTGSNSTTTGPEAIGNPGYATGAWRTGNEIARLHAGEMVLPANMAATVRANLGATMYGGGGGSVIIQINNPVVRNDSDIDAIARKVEMAMNRRAAQVGLTV